MFNIHPFLFALHFPLSASIRHVLRPSPFRIPSVHVRPSSTSTSSIHAPANVLTLSQPDEDDLEALSFSRPNPSPTPSGPSSSQQQNQRSYAAGPSNPSGVSGKIGQDGPSSKPRAATSTIGWGGVRVETRYTGESTLDEPVSKTIVCILYPNHLICMILMRYRIDA